MSRFEVTLTDDDTPLDIAVKLARAMAHVHEKLAPAMVMYHGEPYVALVPPDAGLAWARAQESERLSDVATTAAGLRPGATLRVNAGGLFETYPPETGPE